MSEFYIFLSELLADSDFFPSRNTSHNDQIKKLEGILITKMLTNSIFNTFLPNYPSWTPWKHEITFGFLMFSGRTRKIGKKNANPTLPVPFRKLYWNKINLCFYFHTSLWCLRRFYEVLNCLHNTFWVTTKKVKIEI